MVEVLLEDKDNWDCQNSSLQGEERSRLVLAAAVVVVVEEAVVQGAWRPEEDITQG